LKDCIAAPNTLHGLKLATRRAVTNIFIQVCKTATRNFVERLIVEAHKNGDFGTQQKMTLILIK
jgi:hypothetical protein